MNWRWRNGWSHQLNGHGSFVVSTELVSVEEVYVVATVIE